MTTREQRVGRARACVGARFRSHGRDPAFGLDCVGVAAYVFARPAPGDYPLRGGDPQALARLIDGAGLTRIADATAGPGDLLLISPSMGQLHLVVLIGRGFVHADVRLRRVVEAPGAPAGPILAAWTED